MRWLPLPVLPGRTLRMGHREISSSSRRARGGPCRPHVSLSMSTLCLCACQGAPTGENRPVIRTRFCCLTGCPYASLCRLAHTCSAPHDFLRAGKMGRQWLISPRRSEALKCSISVDISSPTASSRSGFRPVWAAMVRLSPHPPAPRAFASPWLTDRPVPTLSSIYASNLTRLAHVALAGARLRPSEAIQLLS